MADFPLPQNDDDTTDTSDPAVNLIRGKLMELYEAEPAAKEELKEIDDTGAVSKHQRYIQSLQTSGKGIAEIQTAWHEYYQSLSDAEKHEVWQEFYSTSSRDSRLLGALTPTEEKKPETPIHEKHAERPLVKAVKKKIPKKPESVAELKTRIAARVSADGRLTAKHHLRSLLFGVGTAAFVGLVIVFALFNQLFITPFITPSRAASATPLIIDPNGQATVGPESRIIIPKLNVDAPLVLDAADMREETIQAALEKGVVMYPNTGKPGEQSNPILFGHSSNNLFNNGDYKFVFVMLKKLENGDTFMVNYNSKQYVYRVFNKKIVTPREVSVMQEHPVPSMMTLITCDPPGTSTNRLIVQAEQISPDPASNGATTANSEQTEPAVIPSNAESLFQRLFGWLIPG